MFNNELLIEIMKKNKITAYRLAKDSGVANSTLSTILSGENKNPSSNTLGRLAEALAVSINDFFDDFHIVTVTRLNKNSNQKPRIQTIIDSLDRAGDLKDEDIDEIGEQVEFLINQKRKKK